MAEDVDPPGADRIQVAPALEVFQPDAFAAADRNDRQAFVVFHLGAGVPEHVQVALHPLGVQAHRQSPTSERASSTVAQAYAMTAEGTSSYNRQGAPTERIWPAFRRWRMLRGFAVFGGFR
ncbi:hypothetical protein D3C76_1439550 [compost metagenome]